MLAALATAVVLQADPSPSATPSYSYEECINAPGVFHGCPIPAPDITFLGNGQLFVSGPITEVYQFTEYQNGHAAGTHNQISVRDYSLGAATLNGKRGIYIGLVSPCGGSTYYVYPGAFSETPPETYIMTGHDEPTYIGCPSTPPANTQVSASATPTAPANTQISTSTSSTPTPTDVPTAPVQIGTAETIQAASASLPETGSSTETMLVLAGILLGSGVVTYTISRRRRP